MQLQKGLIMFQMTNKFEKDCNHNWSRSEWILFAGSEDLFIQDDSWTFGKASFDLFTVADSHSNI